VRTRLADRGPDGCLVGDVQIRVREGHDVVAGDRGGRMHILTEHPRGPREEKSHGAAG